MKRLGRKRGGRNAVPEGKNDVSKGKKKEARNYNFVSRAHSGGGASSRGGKRKGSLPTHSLWGEKKRE